MHRYKLVITFATMDVPEIKAMISKQIGDLEKKWKKLAEEERDPTQMMAYKDICEVDGAINALMALLTKLS